MRLSTGDISMVSDLVSFDRLNGLAIGELPGAVRFVGEEVVMVRLKDVGMVLVWLQSEVWILCPKVLRVVERVQ